MSRKSIKKLVKHINFVKKIVVDISFNIFILNNFKMTGHFRMTQIQGFIPFILLHYGQLFTL